MKKRKINNLVKLSMIFTLSMLTSCVSNNVNNPVTTATPSVIESSNPIPTTSTSPDVLSPEPGSTPMPTPTATQSSGGQTNTSNQNSLTLQSDFLKVSFVDYYSTDLKWSTVNGAKSYKVYQDGKLIADNITDLGYSVKNLTPNTDYTFEISAVNDAGESNKAMLKVRTFIPGNSSGSNNSGNNNQGTVVVPSPSANVQFSGGYN